MKLELQSRYGVPIGEDDIHRWIKDMHRDWEKSGLPWEEAHGCINSGNCLVRPDIVEGTYAVFWQTQTYKVTSCH